MVGTKMPEGKKTNAASGIARPQNNSVGEMLRVARMGKNLSIEEVSVALRIRTVQLKALEENNIEALPGMMYAIGFVRSYANFVGLNGPDVVRQFKTDHGHALDPSQLSFPEPLAESRMPGPLMAGVGAFLAIVVLVLWTLYSNAQDGSGKSAEQIPPPPVVTTTAEAPPEYQHPPVTLPAAAAPPMISGAELVVAAPPAEPMIVPSLPDASAKEAIVPAVKVPAVKKNPVAENTNIININRGKGRIVLHAMQDVWVQVTDVHKGVIYKKVLKPGEQYVVPDQPGLSLVTASAGGLDVYVDGQKAPSLGRPGEIVHGIALDPAGLRKKRIRVND